MNENLKIDDNTRYVLGAVTNDANQYIKNVRVNPITGALIVEANVTSTNTMIGSTIPGGTNHSVLFLGLGGTLSQDNANFYYDYTQHFLGLGTTSPAATLDIEGTFKYSDGSQSDGYVLTSDADGNATWQPPAVGTSGYDLIQNNGVSVTQRSTINLSTLLTATDTGGKTALTINTTNLANDNTFVTTLAANNTFATALVANTTFTTALGNDSNFISTLTSNSTFQSSVVTFINNSGSLSVNLATQVTGVLPIANGGTASSTALSGSTIMISNGSAIVQGAAGTTTTVLHGNASGAPTYSAVSLTADVAGTLGVNHGGTGATTLAAHGVLIGNGTGAIAVTATGTTGQVLTSNGASADPTFQTSTSTPDFSLLSTVTSSAVSVPTSTTTVVAEFTSLTGDTDDEYSIQFEFTASGAVGNNAFWGLRLNNDSTSNHYLYTNIAVDTAVGSLSALAVQIRLVGATSSTSRGAQVAFGNVKIKASKTIAGVNRLTLSQCTSNSIGALSVTNEQGAGAWSDTTNQITSVQLVCFQDSGSTVTVDGISSIYKINR